METSTLPKILKVDVGGLPVEWMDWQTAVNLVFNDKVVWSFGDHPIRLHGGRSRDTGLRSMLELDTILAVPDRSSRFALGVPPLNNRELFHRDHHLCLYCGGAFPDRELTRDHIVPLSKRGADEWTNVVTACRACNHRKADRTLEQAGMKLLAVPYKPNHAEFLILSNRRILADQMEFLKQYVPQREHYAG